MFDLLTGNVLSHDKNSIYWMSTDSPENYKKHCEIHGDSFKKKWADEKITYILNSQGYRCPEWNLIEWEESVLIFGDSCIAGVGVPENHTLSHLLSKILRRPVINLGVSGSSNLFSLYNMIRMKTANIKPYAVINVETTPERTITFENPKIGSTGLNHWGSWNHDDLYYKRFWLKEEENYFQHTEHIRKNKKLLWSDTKYLNYELNELPIGVKKAGRDNLHPGMDTYAKQAKHIMMHYYIC